MCPSPLVNKLISHYCQIIKLYGGWCSKKCCLSYCSQSNCGWAAWLCEWFIKLFYDVALNEPAIKIQILFTKKVYCSLCCPKLTKHSNWMKVDFHLERGKNVGSRFISVVAVSQWINLSFANLLKFYFCAALRSGQSQNCGKQILCFDCGMDAVLWCSSQFLIPSWTLFPL